MNPEFRPSTATSASRDKLTDPKNVDVSSVRKTDDDSFTFHALMIHAWLSQLLDEAIEIYVARRNSKFFGMQSGQAQRGFLRIFGHLGDVEFQRLVQNMYWFTTCEDPVAVVLFRALDALSAEHDAQGDFSGMAASAGGGRAVEAVRWMRESMDRWCEWVDAFVHVQTHAQWHLAPDCFDNDLAKRRSALKALKKRRMERFFSSRRPNWQNASVETTRYYRELPIWHVMPQAQISQPQKPWPHPELDDAVISLWPLVRRHHWTFGDLLTVMKDLLPDPESYPLQGERNLATYCLHSLRLRKTVQGKTSKLERPTGYVVALRLFPPMPPRPVFYFGEALAGEDLGSAADFPGLDL
jgi:hypothetical protein